MPTAVANIFFAPLDDSCIIEHMIDWGQTGKLLIVLGTGLLLVGGLFVLVSHLNQDGRLSWIGRLPGDIRIERRGFSCVAPLATSLIVSILLTIVLNIVIRLLKR